MTVPGHAIANSYDKGGRLTATTAGGRTLSYLYDAASNRTRVTHPDGVYFTYEYDPLSRVTAVKENGAATLASYSYDDLSRRTVATLGNGTATSYGYEADGALDSLTNNVAGTAQDVTFGFDYNRVNQITFKTASTPLYDWTALFDRSVASSHNGLNQLTQVQDGGLVAAITHDPNGNLTGDGVWAYTYDAGNRLKTATKPGVSASYSYDGLGRRTAKTGSGVAATWYLSDGVAMVAEYAAATGTAPLRRYVHGPGVDEPIVVYDGAGTATKRWFYTNWQGSVIAEANASGSVTSTYRYGPYGEPDVLTGAMFRYTGQLLDAETGLYYYKARYYSPQLGRFLQTDPIGYADQMNLYAYVGGDPLNFTDPSGFASCANPKDSNCDTFLKRVDDARNAVGKLKGIIGGILQKREDGGELTDEETTVLTKIEENFGKNDSKTLGKISDGLDRLDSFLANDNTFVADGRGKVPSGNFGGFFPRGEARTQAQFGVSGPVIAFGDSFFTADPARQARTVVHEGVHSFVGNQQLKSLDVYFFEGRFPNFARDNPAKALFNPDSFACTAFSCSR